MGRRSLEDVSRKDALLPTSEENQLKTDDEELRLKRKVGLFSAVALIVGCIIGSGIFITPGGVLVRSGSVGLSLVIWTVCGLIALMGALAYAELGVLIPRSGAEYAYYLEALGGLHPFWGPLPAFLFSWLFNFLIKPAGMAASCLAIAKYSVVPILDLLDMKLCDERDLDSLMKLAALLILGIAMAINCISISWTVRISNALTVTKLGAIAILIGCGVYQLCKGETQHLKRGFEGSSTDFSNIALSFYGVLFTYDGWSYLNMITEELKNPSVNLPRAIMIGIPLVTVCYVAVNIAYLTVLSPEEIIASSAVAVDVGNRLLGPMAFIIPVCVIFSTFGALLVTTFSGARSILATAREGHMIGILSCIHCESMNPIPALIFLGILAAIMILAQSLAGLIDFCVFAMWIFYVVSMILVLVLRKIRPNAHRSYRVPLFIPITMIIIGSYFIVAPIISNPTVEYLFIIGAILLGILFYIPFVYYKYSFGLITTLTRIVQKTLNVGPAAKASLD